MQDRETIERQLHAAREDLQHQVAALRARIDLHGRIRRLRWMVGALVGGVVLLALYARRRRRITSR